MLIFVIVEIMIMQLKNSQKLVLKEIAI